MVGFPVMKTAADKLEQYMTEPLVRSFYRHLNAEGKRLATMDHYLSCADQFVRWWGRPVNEVRRRDVTEWLTDLRDRYSPASVNNRYRGLRQFFLWLIKEEEIERNPMDGIARPEYDPPEKDVATQDEMRAVFAYLEREKRWRDCALLGLLFDTGMRASELAEARLEQLDLDKGTLYIPSRNEKTRRGRYVRVSPQVVRYLDRYYRKPRFGSDRVLSGRKGPLTRSGVYQAVRACFEDAGIKGKIFGAHDMRHTSASHVAESGLMSESEAMHLYGWSDSEQWRRYTSQARQKAALRAHEAASPLERLRDKR